MLPPHNPRMAADPYPPLPVPSPAAQRKINMIVGPGLLLGAIIGIWYLVDQFVPYWHFRTVEKGQFYRSSQLGEKDLADAIERYGIKTVINLRAEHERAHGDWWTMEHRVAKENGARVLDVPLLSGTPPNKEEVEKLLRAMDDPANMPVLVHCYHGSIRSAAIEGLFRIEYMGEDGETAYDRMTTWGRDLEEDYPLIADFVKNYVARAKKAKAKK